MNQMADFSQIGQLIKEMVAEVGFELEIDVTESTTASSRVGEGDFDMYLNNYTGETDSHSNVARFYLSTQTANFTGFNSPELDALIVAASGEADWDKRGQIYDQIKKIIVEDNAIAMYLIRPPQIILYNSQVAGLTFRSTGSTIIMGAGWLE
jgi:peptide/nickel transport system substrate-binding protein